MATFIATGSKVQLPLGTVQVHKVQFRRLIDPEFRRIFKNNTGPTHRYQEIPSSLWNFNEKTSILTVRSDFGELEIDYTPPLDTDAVNRIVPITNVNTNAKRTRKVTNSAHNILEEQQESKISNEGTIIGDLKVVRGFKSLYPFAKEGEAISKKVMPVKLTSSVGDGSLAAIATNTSQLTSILGSNPAATGTLKRIVTSGAPASLLKQMEKSLPNLSQQKLRTFASELSVKPLLTIESLKPEKSPSLVSVQAASNIYKNKLKNVLNNSAFNLNPLGAFPGLGRTKQNSAAQFIGTLLNKVGTAFGNILNGLKVFGDNPAPSITSSFGGSIKDLIEVGGAQTNISSYVSKGNLTNIQTPEISYILQDRNKFLGYATPDDYQFTFVNSTDELIKEFQSSARGPQSENDDAIGGLFVHETSKFSGPPEKANAKSINDTVKKVQLKILTKEIQDTNSQSDGKTAAETAIERISNKPNDYG